MRIQARSFELFTEKWPQIGLKRGLFWHYVFFVPIDCKKKHHSAFSDSVNTFRHKKFENRLKNGCFIAMGALKTCKIGHLLS